MLSNSAPRILSLRLSASGDCVMASPLAQALRAHFPHSHIAWAVQEKSRATHQRPTQTRSFARHTAQLRRTIA